MSVRYTRVTIFRYGSSPVETVLSNEDAAIYSHSVCRRIAPGHCRCEIYGLADRRDARAMQARERSRGIGATPPARYWVL
jgi:hypothetical protein